MTPAQKTSRVLLLSANHVFHVTFSQLIGQRSTALQTSKDITIRSPFQPPKINLGLYFKLVQYFTKLELGLNYEKLLLAYTVIQRQLSSHGVSPRNGQVSSKQVDTITKKPMLRRVANTVNST